MYQYAIRVWFNLRPEFDTVEINERLELGNRVQAALRPELAALDKAPQALAEDCDDGLLLTERTCDDLTAVLRKVRGHEHARLSAARLIVSLDADAAERAEWFVVWPDTWMDIDGGSSEGITEVRADRVKGREPLRRYSEVPLVTERWMTFVRDEAKLTGVDFVWCPDKGKYAAQQWYTPFGTALLGRGVDHPWFDPATRGDFKPDGFLIVQPKDPAWQIGVRRFTASQARELLPPLADAPAGLAALMAEMRQMPTQYGAEIKAPPCVLREFLPPTDFAYLRIAQPHEATDRVHRTVRLCASAGTRRKLLDAKLAKPGDFVPIEVVDAPPPGVPVFDSRGGGEPLPGVFTGKGLAAVRKTIAKLRAKFDARPKPPMPVKPPEIKKLVPKLKRLLKSQEADVAKGAKPDAIAAAGDKTGIAVPARWAELLGAVDGFIVDNCYALDGTAELRVASTGELPEEHQGARQMIGFDEGNVPATHLGVASSDLGDCVFLDTAKLTPEGDCPVEFMNHETLETEMTWPAIGLFLSDALVKSDEGE